MNALDFIVKYWAQAVILIAAIGYVLKSLLDYRFKKNEIWHTLYSQKKIEHLGNYFSQAYQLRSDIISSISIYMRADATLLNETELDQLSLAKKYKYLGQLHSQLPLFLTKKECEQFKLHHFNIGQLLQRYNSLVATQFQNQIKVDFEPLYKEALSLDDFRYDLSFLKGA